MLHQGLKFFPHLQILNGFLFFILHTTAFIARELCFSMPMKWTPSQSIFLKHSEKHHHDDNVSKNGKILLKSKRNKDEWFSTAASLKN